MPGFLPDRYATICWSRRSNMLILITMRGTAGREGIVAVCKIMWGCNKEIPCSGPREGCVRVRSTASCSVSTPYEGVCVCVCVCIGVNLGVCRVFRGKSTHSYMVERIITENKQLRCIYMTWIDWLMFQRVSLRSSNILRQDKASPFLLHTPWSSGRSTST